MEIRISPPKTLLFHNTSQPQVFKKDKYHQENRQGGYPATKVNATEVTKNNKDKANKNLGYIDVILASKKVITSTNVLKNKKLVTILVIFILMTKKKNEELE